MLRIREFRLSPPDGDAGRTRLTLPAGARFVSAYANRRRLYASFLVSDLAALQEERTLLTVRSDRTINLAARAVVPLASVAAQGDGYDMVHVLEMRWPLGGGDA